MGFTTHRRLPPGKDFSFYSTLGYRVENSWDIVLYYDSYRFEESNNVAVTDGVTTVLVSRPKSPQDQIGLKVQHTFDR